MKTSNTSTILEKKNKIIKTFGPWTAHNIYLGHNIYTIGKHAVEDDIKLRRTVQIIEDISQKPLDKLRILDLGCLEGLYAVELALRGANVVAIEGRLANIEKARLAKEVLSLKNLELVQEDVRNFSSEKYGFFDVVLCLGILYHLPVPDVFDFARNLGGACKEFIIIDTLLSLRSKIRVIDKGVEYWGRNFIEHLPWHSPEKKTKKLWASLDNSTSFWLTKPSLYRLFATLGFTSIYECNSPPEPNKPRDRLTMVAVKGKRSEIISTSFPNNLPINDFPEKKAAKTIKKMGHRILLEMKSLSRRKHA